MEDAYDLVRRDAPYELQNVSGEFGRESCSDIVKVAVGFSLTAACLEKP